jgi:hypothetical protein
LPKLDTTPPVTKTYFADIDATSSLSFWDWPYLVGTFKYGKIRAAEEEEKSAVFCDQDAAVREAGDGTEGTREESGASGPK